MFLFIITHLGSDSHLLCDALNRHPYIKWSKSKLTYEHPKDLFSMKTDFSKIFFDRIEFNHNLHFYHSSSFIYVVREPSRTLPYIVQKGYTLEKAYDYYCFRLRRIYEMVRLRGGLFLTYDDLLKNETYEKITNHLGIKKQIIPSSFLEEKEETIYFPRAELCYEYYYGVCKKLL